MQQGQFKAAAMKEIDKIDSTYTNARYAALGNQTVGEPFMLYKQPGAYFTMWTPAGQAESNMKKEMNLPTNNNAFRQGMIKDGVGIANRQNIAWLNRTQTLSNNGATTACVNNADCAAWPGTKCNRNYQSWNDAKGNQGNFCSEVIYPELKNGVYTRKLQNEGGIGKQCNTDQDCGDGYSCNQTTDMYGKNIQQTGYCSQVYECSDGTSHYMGYPYNASIPIPPSPQQNNNGQGYATKEMCNFDIRSQQDCVQNANGKWYAVYPGYCPLPALLRKDLNPQGALLTSTPTQNIKVPAYATNSASVSTNAKPLGALGSFSMNSMINASRQENEPLQYSMSINPMPPNLR